jgi:hypothetical protein
VKSGLNESWCKENLLRITSLKVKACPCAVKRISNNMYWLGDTHSRPNPNSQVAKRQKSLRISCAPAELLMISQQQYRQLNFKHFRRKFEDLTVIDPCPRGTGGDPKWVARLSHLPWPYWHRSTAFCIGTTLRAPNSEPR